MMKTVLLIYLSCCILHLTFGEDAEMSASSGSNDGVTEAATTPPEVHDSNAASIETPTSESTTETASSANEEDADDKTGDEDKTCRCAYCNANGGNGLQLRSARLVGGSFYPVGRSSQAHAAARAKGSSMFKETKYQDSKKTVVQRQYGAMRNVEARADASARAVQNRMPPYRYYY